jgi:FkbM family methyltransferase
MKDYSQYGEQKYILQALGYSPDVIGISQERCGRLLEIGAFDPFAMSNSRALIELGWSAVMFEPSPGPLKSLVKEYGDNQRVEVVGLPVSVSGGFMEMRITDDAVTSDAGNVAHLKKWDGYGFYGTMTTMAVMVDEIVEHWGGQFDFVSIDTEGTSVDIFDRLVKVFQPLPRCVVVEHDSRWCELRKAAEAGGYRLMHDPKENGTNVVLELKP